MKKGRKAIHFVLAVVILLGSYPTAVCATVKKQDVRTPELVCDYRSVDEDSPMREVEYYDIHTEGMLLTVEGKTAHSYARYRVTVQRKSSSSFMFYPESYGVPDEENGFLKTLDFSGEENGDYLVSVRFNNDGSNSFQKEPQMKAVVITKNSQGVFVKEFSAIIKENARIRNAKKTAASKYLDTSLADMGHELRNGRQWSSTGKKKLTASEKKTIKAFSDKITKGAKNDYEKLLAIHDYLAENLYYDQPYNDAGKTKKLQMAKKGQVTLSPYTLVVRLKNGKKTKTVCNGFSALFAALARSQKIPCRLVNGRSIQLKDTNWDKLSNTELATSTHTWNEAYVNGHWITIDVTRDCSNDYLKTGYVKASPILYRYSGFDASDESFASALLYLKYR